MYIWGPCHFGSSSISRRLEYFLGQVKSIKRIGRELDTLVGSWVEEHAMRKAKSEQIDKPDFIDVMLSIIEDVDMFFHLNTPLILIFLRTIYSSPPRILFENILSLSLLFY